MHLERPSTPTSLIPAGSLHIDCDECAMVGTSTCEDCIVTFLCGHDDGGEVVIAAPEVRALRLLHDAGLAPGLRHRARDDRSVQQRMVRSGTGSQGP